MTAHATKFQAITGVRDILPPESALWNRVEQTAREVFATYGYGEIRLPIFEEEELFSRSIGSETDIVTKEMFQLASDLDPAVEEARQEILRRAEIFNRTHDLGSDFQSVKQAVQSFLDQVIAAVNSGKQSPGSEEFPTFRKIEAFHNTTLPAHEYVTQIVILVRMFGRHQRISVRPEATASVVRAYIEHGMQVKPGNTKLYYVGPMFRREKPQKGRYRQFYQIGAELLGSSDHPALDAEVIEMLLVFFERLHLQGAILHLNSIGDKNCRPAYIETLRAALEKVRDKLGPDSQRRIETNALRVLDSKLPEEQALIETLPRIADHLCDACREHYAELKRQLALRNIQYRENWRLVRGLDYYMRTTFEITAPGLGSQNAVCGGGRYDGLVERLGGPPTKGIGFAIGTDRLMLSLEKAGEAAPIGGLDVFLAWFGAATYPAAVELARKLRAQGIAVELPAVEMKFGKSLNLADRLGARYAVILGEQELAARQFTVKRLADADQKTLSEPELLAYLTEAKVQPR